MKFIDTYIVTYLEETFADVPGVLVRQLAEPGDSRGRSSAWNARCESAARDERAALATPESTRQAGEMASLFLTGARLRQGGDQLAVEARLQPLLAVSQLLHLRVAEQSCQPDIRTSGSGGSR